MRPFIPIGPIPLRGAILMPGHRCPQPRLLDNNRLRERRKIRSIDLLCNRQQLGMSVKPQTRIHNLQRRSNIGNHIIRRISRRLWLYHPGRMPPIIARRTPHGIAQWSDKAKRLPHQIRPKCSAALCINHRVFGMRRSLKRMRQIRLQIFEFLIAQRTLKHIKTHAAIRLYNTLIQRTVRIKFDSTAIPQRERHLLALADISIHSIFYRGLHFISPS